jgi:hypothetical protein
LNIKFDVSVEFLDEAEKQLFEILLKQRLSYNDRGSNKPLFIKIKPFLRLVGIVLSILGAALCGATIMSEHNWTLISIRPETYFILFILSSILFYSLPRLDLRMKNWVKKISVRSCAKLSKKALKNARSCVPYKAEYDIKGGSISYYREKDGALKLAWSRKLKGVAIQSDFATIIFKKWTSFIPVIVILHADYEKVETSLSEQNVRCKLISDL